MPPAAVSFLRQALLHPRTIASITPSSPILAQAMVNALPAHREAVVELGPGTGPLTQALLDAGMPPNRLLAVENNRELGLALRRKFPKIGVFMADARHLSRILRDSNWPAQIDCIVSSLGLRAMPEQVVEDIIRQVNQSLRIGGVFVQYSYRAGSPVPETLCKRLGWKVEMVERVWRNIPPATVWRYTKQ